MTQYLLSDYSQEVRLKLILPVLEFAVGSLQLSRRQALIELGYEDSDAILFIADREEEDRLA